MRTPSGRLVSVMGRTDSGVKRTNSADPDANQTTHKTYSRGFGVPEEEQFAWKYQQRAGEQYDEFVRTGSSRHGMYDSTRSDSYALPEDAAADHVRSFKT